jgi:hypothetical protein
MREELKIKRARRLKESERHHRRGGRSSDRRAWLAAVQSDEHKRQRKGVL